MDKLISTKTQATQNSERHSNGCQMYLSISSGLAAGGTETTSSMIGHYTTEHRSMVHTRNSGTVILYHRRKSPCFCAYSGNTTWLREVTVTTWPKFCRTSVVSWVSLFSLFAGKISETIGPGEQYLRENNNVNISFGRLMVGQFGSCISNKTRVRHAAWTVLSNFGSVFWLFEKGVGQ